ncbi:uncharacterized protein LOC130828800 isoform X2 [Amaranthus tricolor]|uniref:uncharacterized protein LOC130828800 isoform X2 n=1 Tax=Amaranthus tricolor TaxID=29722 RepID=UPI00258A511D|nr:uncharacterized protein LOC130828800 isoform X2 [Amaranthus tricolor]
MQNHIMMQSQQGLQQSLIYRGFLETSQKQKKQFSCASFFDSLDCRHEEDTSGKKVEMSNRREALLSSVGSIACCLLSATSFTAVPPAAVAAASSSEFADMPALRGKDYGKTKMRYPDYTETESGLQFKDLRMGTGPTPKTGDTVVVDWDGYTIGYYGRIFEARNKTKGGSFEGDDKDFFKFKLGSQESCRCLLSGLNKKEYLCYHMDTKDTKRFTRHIQLTQIRLCGNHFGSFQLLRKLSQACHWVALEGL